MSDRELMELAAKATRMGHVLEMPVSRTEVSYVVEEVDGGPLKAWNPFTDDGDALRLAVRLGIAIELHPAWVYARAVPPGDHLRWLEITEGWAHTKDPESCVRRAIVRAAAEIGKAGAQ